MLAATATALPASVLVAAAPLLVLLDEARFDVEAAPEDDVRDDEDVADNLAELRVRFLDIEVPVAIPLAPVPTAVPWMEGVVEFVP